MWSSDRGSASRRDGVGSVDEGVQLVADAVARGIRILGAVDVMDGQSWSSTRSTRLARSLLQRHVVVLGVRQTRCAAA